MVKIMKNNLYYVYELLYGVISILLIVSIIFLPIGYVMYNKWLDMASKSLKIRGEE
jgi:hypothetical protein